MSASWVYFFGAKSGQDIKIGFTRQRRVVDRLKQVNGEQTTSEEYVVLAGVLGNRKDEEKVKRHFAHLCRSDKGRRQEYFEPEPELAEYVAWVRSQYFASPNGEDESKGWEYVNPEAWLPNGENGYQRIPPPESDIDKMVQDWETWPGPLAGTPWSWFPNPAATFQDFFTPPDIVDAVREGMGGIDLDAASHWYANRTHRIPKYFTPGYSAFDHDWEGRVWLNPPYGENDRWWPRVVEQYASGKITQIAIISPVWAFTTQIAKPLMRLVDVTILLVPTPKFWGNSEGRTGTNNPHAIVYIGSRASQMLHSLKGFGIPLEMAWDRVDEFIPQRSV